MSKALVIGSTVCDVMVYLDRLPSREGDAHIHEQTWSLGGCAFNVTSVLHALGQNVDFISPVGTGVYGDFVKAELERLGIQTPISVTGANGCCYCFIESDGERTFLSDHGVEYGFQKEWLQSLGQKRYDFIYLCGLEVEEPTGMELIQSISKLEGQVIFAPGPRGLLIPKDRLEAIYDQHPILHVNEVEALEFSGCKEIHQAVEGLYQRTGKLVIVTLGEKGAIAYDGNWYKAAGIPTKVLDTVGAGDSHLGAFLAASLQGLDVEDALSFANRLASKVVATKGVHVERHHYHTLEQELKKIVYSKRS
ncbi:PfkB family carbohydrate kinase [Streptococcus australis]|uniref:Ribokinase n=1 Tax=Streptococcus oralis TaxID=1303 RepID=A0A6N3D106_STROR|nr:MULTISPECIES: PfkB family carbohydrate kinase [Streptococcus]AMP67092.1 carbohydrate kinase [Streptococcus sp. A12]RSK12214.1 Ribokinase [Streptococcus australis]